MRLQSLRAKVIKCGVYSVGTLDLYQLNGLNSEQKYIVSQQIKLASVNEGCYNSRSSHLIAPQILCHVISTISFHEFHLGQDVTK